MNAALKNVAVSAFASQTLENETWEGLVRWVAEELQQGKQLSDLKAEITTTEKEMKALYDTSVMPAAWRSAKSVVLKAVRLDVTLLKMGKPVGKSSVEAECKIAQTLRAISASVGTSTLSSLTLRYIAAAVKVSAMWSALPTTEQVLVPLHLKWED